MSKKNYKKYEDNKKELIKKEEAEDLAKDLSDTEAVEDLQNTKEPAEEFKEVPVEEIKELIKEEVKEPVVKKVKSDCRLNLRMEDSKDSSVMAILEPNTEVLELDESGEWSYIKVTINGLTMKGFVMNTFLQ